MLATWLTMQLFTAQSAPCVMRIPWPPGVRRESE